MSNKPFLPKIAETIPTGVVVTICGIGAINILLKYPVIALLVGATGIVFGIATLRMNSEKLDKTFAVIGIILSVGSIIYLLAVFFQ